jgi:hypothetical protein
VQPEPEPTPLARAFDHVYLTADTSTVRRQLTGKRDRSSIPQHAPLLRF